jgi:hypothetical protein
MHRNMPCRDPPNGHLGNLVLRGASQHSGRLGRHGRSRVSKPLLVTLPQSQISSRSAGPGRKRCECLESSCSGPRRLVDIAETQQRRGETNQRLDTWIVGRRCERAIGRVPEAKALPKVDPSVQEFAKKVAAWATRPSQSKVHPLNDASARPTRSRSSGCSITAAHQSLASSSGARTLPRSCSRRTTTGALRCKRTSRQNSPSASFWN